MTRLERSHTGRGRRSHSLPHPPPVHKRALTVVTRYRPLLRCTGVVALTVATVVSSVAIASLILSTHAVTQSHRSSCEALIQNYVFRTLPTENLTSCEIIRTHRESKKDHQTTCTSWCHMTHLYGAECNIPYLVCEDTELFQFTT